jgi:hypothetical protein
VSGKRRNVLVVVATGKFGDLKKGKDLLGGTMSRFGFGAKCRVREPCVAKFRDRRIHRTHTRLLPA